MAPKSKEKRPTINDVAKRAKAGSTSVSRFLRDPTQLSADLQKRIQQAISDLDYIPDPKARALATGHSNVIGVLIPSFDNIVFADILRGIHNAVAATDFQIQIANTQYNVAEEDRLIKLFVGQRPAAMILTGLDQSETSRHLLQQADMPLVQIIDDGDRALDMMIGFSHQQAAKSVVSHLFDQGYRQIGCIAAGMDKRVYRRLEGFRQQLADLGCYKPQYEFTCHKRSSVQLGRDLMADLIQRQPDIDAVFCLNDDLAIGALFECQAQQVSVPRQMGLVGFHDLDMMAASYPPITSVRTYRYDIGLKAIDYILKRLQGETPDPALYQTGFDLIPRASTCRNG